MLIQKLTILNIIKDLKKKKINSYYFLDELFIDYLQKYNPLSLFEDKSFVIKHNENFLYCPITIEKKRGKKYLNFFGEPCFCIYNKYERSIFLYFAKELKGICEKEKITNFNLVFENSELNEKNLENYFFKKKLCKKISNIKYIDLNLNVDDIKKSFKKGLKHLINKDYPSLSYLIIDKENYNNHIINMKNMHQEVSKKITRSDETWLINEKMIKLNKGFLVQVSDKKNIISYSLFFSNGWEAIYFSSCTLKEYFKIYKNITHKSIFEAIKYLKKTKFKNLTLGETKIIHSNQIISDKEKNIFTFKSSFGGEIYTRYYIDKYNIG